jgi:uncharacterized protein (TIGR00730 family)
MSIRKPELPATRDEELLEAESPAIVSTYSEAERLARIQRELEMSFTALASLGKAVSVFGSARVSSDDPLYELARRTTRLLGEHGYAIITGGGPGVMEAANRGAVEAGVRSVGLNIELPFEEQTNPYVDLQLRFHYFFTRKVMFVRYACAFVVFPGGFGTLDELFEALTLRQTGKMRSFPVVLMVAGHWSGLLGWLRERVLGEGMVSPADLRLLSISDDPAEVLELVEAGAADMALD